MNNLDKVPLAIAVVGLIAALFLFNSNQKLTGDISNALANKKVTDKQLEIYSGINNYFGRYSSGFYAKDKQKI